MQKNKILYSDVTKNKLEKTIDELLKKHFKNKKKDFIVYDIIDGKVIERFL